LITRRNLIKKSVLGGLGAGASLGLSGCGEGSMGPAQSLDYDFVAGKPLPWMNWAKNQGCQPAHRIAPQSEDELMSIIKASQGGTLRPMGAGHSFSAVVPTDGTLLSTDLLNGIIDVDDLKDTVDVWSGTRLHQLGPELDGYGQALANLPDINYQTVAGAISTSTHGSGVTMGSLSSMVEAFTIATPSGELVTCNKLENSELFAAACCGLGALGVITRVKMRTVPAFSLEQKTAVEELEDVLADIDSEKSSNRNFEFLAFPHTSKALVVRTNEVDPSMPILRSGEEDPTAIFQIRDAYKQLGVLPLVGEFAYQKIIEAASDGATSINSGPSYRILAHDRIVPFREMEYTVPADAGPACLREILSTIVDRKIPVIFPIEYRYTLQDDIWLSMFNQQDGCSISIHQFADEDYREYFAVIEPIFEKYSGRPHWGKLHTLGPEDFPKLYPSWQQFLDIRESLDPNQLMINPHLAQLFGLQNSAVA
jgi:FAD-linked oxidoreductase